MIKVEEGKKPSEFMIDEGVSPGISQMIQICRAILRKSKILILDEATASIEPTEEVTVLKMIREQLKDTTMLTIAHRLATIATSDQIMVINNGSIAEMESPHVLK